MSNAALSWVHDTKVMLMMKARERQRADLSGSAGRFFGPDGPKKGLQKTLAQEIRQEVRTLMGPLAAEALDFEATKCERRSWTQFELRTSTSHFARFGTEVPPTFHSPICLWGPECGSLRLRIPSAGLVTSRFYNFVIAIEFKVLEHRCLSAGPTNLNPERRFPVGHAKENARVIL